MSEHKKYLITWNAGYGSSDEIIEAENQDEAENEAYEKWKEDAEMNSDYSANLLTPELAHHHGYDYAEETGEDA